MPVLSDRFSDRYQVQAPLETVAFFHKDTRALKRLTPPPVFVQIRKVEPMAEGSRSDFTLWFGPLPVHWLAVHSHVDPKSGFTDTQARGPMKQWVHRHHWQAVNARVTEMQEEVTYEHFPGPRGWLTRLLFARPLIRMMFTYRRWVIQHSIRS